jgi:hypothetical protein
LWSKKVLTSQQIEKLEITEQWLGQIIDSVEFKKLDYHPDLTLGDALQAVQEILNAVEIQDYTQPTQANTDN